MQSKYANVFAMVDKLEPGEATTIAEGTDNMGRYALYHRVGKAIRGRMVERGLKVKIELVDEGLKVTRQ